MQHQQVAHRQPEHHAGDDDGHRGVSKGEGNQRQPLQEHQEAGEGLGSDAGDQNAASEAAHYRSGGDHGNGSRGEAVDSLANQLHLLAERTDLTEHHEQEGQRHQPVEAGRAGLGKGGTRWHSGTG